MTVCDTFQKCHCIRMRLVIFELQWSYAIHFKNVPYAIHFKNRVKRWIHFWSVSHTIAYIQVCIQVCVKSSHTGIHFWNAAYVYNDWSIFEMYAMISQEIIRNDLSSIHESPQINHSIHESPPTEENRLDIITTAKNSIWFYRVPLHIRHVFSGVPKNFNMFSVE